MTKKLRFDTRAIHAALPAGSAECDPIALPIYQTASFAFEDMAALEAIAIDPNSGFAYSRLGNPTVRALECAIADLEGTADAIGFASGMAAIHGALLGVLSHGDHLIAPKSLYGGAYALFERLFERLGIERSYVDARNVDAFRAALRPNTKVIYAETLSNPLLEFPDLAALAELAHANAALLVVDSTFVTPWALRPCELGADVVLHSATKYLGGHGDLVAGVVACRAELAAKIRAVAVDAGGILAPLEAWLILRGLKTLGLRMARHSSNAARVAQFLTTLAPVTRVVYPTLPDHPDHARAKVLPGAGGVLAFDVATEAEALRCLDRLTIFRRAGSLGDTHSLAVLPSRTSHRALTPAARSEAGLLAGTIRLAIGLEDPADLEADLAAALGE